MCVSSLRFACGAGMCTIAWSGYVSIQEVHRIHVATACLQGVRLADRAFSEIRPSLSLKQYRDSYNSSSYQTCHTHFSPAIMSITSLFSGSPSSSNASSPASTPTGQLTPATSQEPVVKASVNSKLVSEKNPQGIKP